jgi:hypothetical protein
MLEDDEQMSEEDVEQLEEEWMDSDEVWAIRDSNDVVERVVRRVGEEVFGSESFEITRRKSIFI